LINQCHRSDAQHRGRRGSGIAHRTCKRTGTACQSRARFRSRLGARRPLERVFRSLSTPRNRAVLGLGPVDLPVHLSKRITDKIGGQALTWPRGAIFRFIAPAHPAAASVSGVPPSGSTTAGRRVPSMVRRNGTLRRCRQRLPLATRPGLCGFVGVSFAICPACRQVQQDDARNCTHYLATH